MNNLKELNTQPAIPYPRHVDSFECYFTLGERRTLREAAKIRYQELKPTHFRKNKEHKTSEEAFYVRFRRWAKKERWDEWVRIKEEEERRLKQEEVNERAEFVERLKFYRSIIQDSLDVFGYKVNLAIRLKDAVDKGDMEEVEELKKKISLIGEVKIDNFGEARSMLELYKKIVNQLEEKQNKD